MIGEGINNLAIVKEGWKLLPAYRNSGEELYNLDSDPGEKVSLLDRYPGKAAALQQALDVIKK